MMRNRFITSMPQIGVTFASHVDLTFDRAGNWHTHEDMQILVVVSGGFVLGVGSQRAAMSPGDVAVLPSKLPHVVPAEAEPTEVSLLDLRFRLEQRSDVTAALRQRDWPLPLRGSPHEALALARELEEASAAAATAPFAFTRAIWSLLSVMERGMARSAESSVDHRIAIAERFMLRHLAEPLSAEQIASACELSVSQLNRLYHKHGGAGPVARLRQLRVDRARELLAASLMSIKEIAGDCGFICPNHFCRVFKEEVTLTPGDYRRRATGSHPA